MSKSVVRARRRGGEAARGALKSTTSTTAALPFPLAVLLARDVTCLTLAEGGGGGGGGAANKLNIGCESGAGAIQ